MLIKSEQRAAPAAAPGADPLSSVLHLQTATVAFYFTTQV